MKATALRGPALRSSTISASRRIFIPKNKQDVGSRLALVARHVAYHQDGFVWSSPIYRQSTETETACAYGSTMRMA